MSVSAVWPCLPAVDPATARVDLQIFDLLERTARMLVRDRMKAGRHRVTWVGRGTTGNSVAGGIYFSRLRAGDYERSRKVVLER